MSISFNSIPIDVRTPGQYLEFDNSRAVNGLPGQPHRILVIGQRLAAGSVLQAVPTQILSGAAAQDFFGKGSMLAEMCLALRAANRRTEVWAIALDEAGGGVKATAKLTFTGPATKDGALALLIGGKAVPVAVAKDDTADEIATAVAAAITARGDVAFAAAVGGVGHTNDVVLTAKWKGLTGNFLDVRVNYYQGEALPAGVGLVITAASGGTTNPDIATAIAAMGDTQYHTVITPFTDAANLAALETELEARWGPMIQKEGQAFAAATGAHSALVTLGTSRNSAFVSIMGGGKSPTPPWIWAAVTGAIDAAEPDPARPRQTLLLPGILAPAKEDQFTAPERDLLLHDGVATHVADDSGKVYIERLITTYQTNGSNEPDTSYLDVETMRTLAYLRFSLRQRIALRYPRHKLADDGTRFGAGQAIVTPSTMKTEILALATLWVDSGLIEDFEQFAKELVVERSASDPNRIDALIPPNLINQFRVFAGQIQFLQ
jgi:phage tail sheath gpL-like